MMESENVRNYSISINENDMFITILRSGKTYYTNYNEQLYEIMKSGIFTGAATNGSNKGDYLKFTCANSKQTAYFHHIVFCFYYRGLTKENYISILQSFSDELSKQQNKLEVDHLKDGVYNNRIWNLSLMTHSDNIKKRFVSRCFKYIFDIATAYDGEGYRVQFAYINKDIYIIRHYCNTAKELNNIYDYFKKHKWELRKSALGVISQNNAYELLHQGLSFLGVSLPFFKNNDRLYDIQRELYDMDKRQFDNPSLRRAILAYTSSKGV